LFDAAGCIELPASLLLLVLLVLFDPQKSGAISLNHMKQKSNL
jgi:hypothetical protein